MLSCCVLAIRFRALYLDLLHRLVVDPRFLQSGHLLADQEVQLVQLQQHRTVGAARVYSELHCDQQGGGHEFLREARPPLRGREARRMDDNLLGGIKGRR